ncbi:hypothetical protein Tco_0381333 [Tanacetum coccineum]
MSWFSRCSWCGGPFNGGNCRHYTNKSFGDEFVNNPEPILNDETPDFFYPPSQSQTSSLDQCHCFHCKDPLERGERCKRCSCKWCGSGLSEGFCLICASSNKHSSIDDPNPNSFNDTPNHAQPEDIQDLLHKLLKDLQIISEELAEYINSPSWNCPAFYDDDDEYTIQYREYLENSSEAITPDLPTEELDNSLSMGDEHLSTIPETESDEIILRFSPILTMIVLSSDDDYGEDIDYVKASPPDSELVNLEEVKDFYPDDGEIDTDILLKIKDGILRKKLLNINLLIAKIESLNDNPTPNCVLKSLSSFPMPVEDNDSFFENSLRILLSLIWIILYPNSTLLAII